MRILNAGSGYDRTGTDYIDVNPKFKDVKKCDFNRQRFPYPNNAFDEVISRCIISHIANPYLYFSECNRVLKVGGRIKLTTDTAGFWGAVGKAHKGAYEKAMTYGKDDSTYSLYTTHHVENWLKKFGFTDIHVRHKTSEKVQLIKKPVMFILYGIGLYPHIEAVATKKSNFK